MKYHDGSVFEGKFVEGIPQNGIGTVYYNKNGEKAVGTFKHNTLNGYGIWHNKDNFGVTYEGEWKDRKIISEIAKTFSEGIITYGQYDGSAYCLESRFLKKKTNISWHLSGVCVRELVLNFVKVMNWMIK